MPSSFLVSGSVISTGACTGTRNALRRSRLNKAAAAFNPAFAASSVTGLYSTKCAPPFRMPRTLPESATSAMFSGLCAQFLCLLQNFFRSRWIVKVNDQRVKLLLLDSSQCRLQVARTVQGNAEAGQNFAQHIRRGVVARYQQCLNVHRSMIKK